MHSYFTTRLCLQAAFADLNRYICMAACSQGQRAVASMLKKEKENEKKEPKKW